MFFNIITLLVALSISGVAIYYSVAGLAAIFAASVIPVIIMGGVLEVGKLVAAVWLHKNWRTAVWWLKYYLGAAVVILMFITSMGIFGFLSKSHVEQTAATAENVAQIERITSDIARQRAIIARAEERVSSLESNTGGVDGNLQTQIDREQERINTAYSRVEPAIQSQLDIIRQENDKKTQQIQIYENDVANIDSLLSSIQSAIETGDIKKAQQLSGTNPDGVYGPKTAAAVEAFRDRQLERRQTALENIQRIKAQESSIASTAQAEIERIRARVEEEVRQSNQLIARLRDQLGKTSRADIDEQLDEQLSRIRSANEKLDELVQQKVSIESQARQLEAEVGPIKYIAEFIYADEVDRNLLEEAVRWVIIIIIFVFDPLAVLLLIASQYSFEEYWRNKKAAKKPYDVYRRLKPAAKEDLKPKFVKSTERQNRTIWPDEIQPDELTDIAETNKIEVESDARDAVGFKSPIAFGINFPAAVKTGKLFLRMDQTPTKLYEFNGESWRQIDKSRLDYTEYSDKYIETLIRRIGDNQYDPALLNDDERQHIEERLTRE